jgi:HptB-dependent secretion and biofilm anti anti-sigma factor
MQTHVRTHAGIARIVLQGRFDFGSHRDFKASCEEPLGASDVCEIEIDMGGVQYLDSSALGMLLILKERAGATNKQVAITNCRGVVKQVLDIAKFGQLFLMR